MTTKAAAKMVRIIGESREQVTGACRRNNRFGAGDPMARFLGVEWNQEVKALAAVGVDCGEDRRILVDTEEVLIERDLCRVLRIGLLEPVMVERAPALGIDRL